MGGDQLGQRAVAVERGPHQAADDRVGLPEGHPLLDEVLGQVGGRRGRRVGGRLHAVEVEAERGHQPAHRGEGQGDLVHGVEQRLLVLLEISVVGEGQALQRGQEAGEVTDQAAGLAAGQLGDVGVLLLREHRAAGGVGVGEAGEAELLGGPQDDLLADPAEVDADQGQREQGLRHEVAVGHRVQAVLEARREPEVLGHAGRVEGQRGSGQRARAQRRHVETPAAVDQPVDVAGQGPAVGQEVVGQADGLRPLEVRVAGQVGGRPPRRRGRRARPGGRRSARPRR